MKKSELLVIKCRKAVPYVILEKTKPTLGDVGSTRGVLTSNDPPRGSKESGNWKRLWSVSVDPGLVGLSHVVSPVDELKKYIDPSSSNDKKYSCEKDVSCEDELIQKML